MWKVGVWNTKGLREACLKSWRGHPPNIASEVFDQRSIPHGRARGLWGMSSRAPRELPAAGTTCRAQHKSAIRRQLFGRLSEGSKTTSRITNTQSMHISGMLTKA